MPRLLVINPNTTASVSALLQRHVQAAVGDAISVRTITGRFGAPYISCEASYAVANHAVLDSPGRSLARRHPTSKQVPNQTVNQTANRQRPNPQGPMPC